MTPPAIPPDRPYERGGTVSGFGNPFAPDWGHAVLRLLDAVAEEHGWEVRHSSASRRSESRYVEYRRGSEAVSVRVSGHPIDAWMDTRTATGEREHPDRFNLLPIYGRFEGRSVKEAVERLAQPPLRESFVPREDTLRDDAPDYPVGTRRRGKEGYVDTLEEVPWDAVDFNPANRIYTDRVRRYVQRPGDPRSQLESLARRLRRLLPVLLLLLLPPACALNVTRFHERIVDLVTGKPTYKANCLTLTMATAGSKMQEGTGTVRYEGNDFKLNMGGDATGLQAGGEPVEVLKNLNGLSSLADTILNSPVFNAPKAAPLVGELHLQNPWATGSASGGSALTKAIAATVAPKLKLNLKGLLP